MSSEVVTYTALGAAFVAVVFTIIRVILLGLGGVRFKRLLEKAALVVLASD